MAIVHRHFARRTKITLIVALGLLSVGCLTIQAFLYAYREAWGSSYSEATEQQLYSVPPYIEKVAHNRAGILELAIVGTRVAVGERNVDRAVKRENLSVNLKPGTNAVNLSINNQPHLLIVDYAAPETYAKAGNKSFPNGVVSIRQSSLGLEKPLVASFDEWAPHKKVSIPNQSGPAEESATPEQIVSRLVSMLEGRRGVPEDNTTEASLSTLQDRLPYANSQVWCVQIALLTSGELGSKHVVRLIASGGRAGAGNVLTGGHTFNELLDLETNSWMLVDPTNYIVGVRWRDGRPVNAVEMRSVMSLPTSELGESMSFALWDPMHRHVVRRFWNELPERIRSDLRFFFSKTNSFFYFSSQSSIYRPSVATKLTDWISLDHRFRLAEQPGFGIQAYIRVITFWLAVLSSPLFLAIACHRVRSNRTVKNKSLERSLVHEP